MKPHHASISPARTLSRRQWLTASAFGFGGLALRAFSAEASPLSPPAPHYRPRVKNVIWLYMDGGLSHIDSFDPKPRLDQEAGRPFPMKIEATQFDSNGPILASPWKFKNYGQSGLPVSELFPYLAQQVDHLAFIRSMTNESAVHANANYWMNTGWGMMGRPSFGSWVSYALGSEAQDLPSFVVINGGLMPTGGPDCFKAGFLPSMHEGSIFHYDDPLIHNCRPDDLNRQARQLRALQQRDASFANSLGGNLAVESAIKNYEMAGQMQVAVPSLADLRGESAATKKLYGFDAPYEHTRTYARECLLARRLIEKGVRFVAVTMPPVLGDTRWDAHGELVKNHGQNALTVDQPIAALLQDLRARGLWEETLVCFTTEFGRTPFTQGTDGRDHNQFGFTVWLAGGGVRGGCAYGSTDEYGYKAVDGAAQIHDLHATCLHLLGLDHEQVTFRFGGRDFRLTDVHGHVIKKILT